MTREAYLFIQRAQMQSERLANLLLLNTALRFSLTEPRTPYRILVNSIPKSGTNLLMKTLSLYPTVRDSKISLHSEMPGTAWRRLQPARRQIWNVFRSVKSTYELAKSSIIARQSERPTTKQVTIGGFHNIFVNGDDLEKLLSQVRNGWFVAGHMPYSDRLERLLVDNQFRMILIIRDPRDVIESELAFFYNTKKLSLHNYYRNLTHDEGLMAIIRGTSQSHDLPTQPNIRDILLGYLPWLSKPYVYVTTFEDLVGPMGGGQSGAQIHQIRAIANHLEISISEDEVKTIQAHAFGGTHTFRKGAIGSWKQKFTEEHRIACKDLIGDLLIQLGYEKDTLW